MIKRLVCLAAVLSFAGANTASAMQGCEGSLESNGIDPRHDITDSYKAWPFDWGRVESVECRQVDVILPSEEAFVTVRAVVQTIFDGETKLTLVQHPHMVSLSLGESTDELVTCRANGHCRIDPARDRTLILDMKDGLITKATIDDLSTSIIQDEGILAQSPDHAALILSADNQFFFRKRTTSLEVESSRIGPGGTIYMDSFETSSQDSGALSAWFRDEDGRTNFGVYRAVIWKDKAKEGEYHITPYSIRMVSLGMEVSRHYQADLKPLQ